MASYDLDSNSTTVVGLDFSSLITEDTSLVGNIVHLVTYQSCEVIVSVLDFEVTTGGTWEYILEHSDDPTFTTSEVVPEDFIIGDIPTIVLTGASSESSTSYSFGYVGGKRHIRPTVTFTNGGSGDASSGLSIVNVLLDTPREAPVA